MFHPVKDVNSALEKLSSIGQERLLGTSYQDIFLDQVESLDIEVFKKQRALWKAGPSQAFHQDLWNSYELSGSKDDLDLGKKLLAAGKMGCIVLAGGKGQRLGAGRPKGTLPISCVHGKSPFQIIAERTLEASKQVGRSLPLAIMTSPGNHTQTLEFFKAHKNFGLADLSFFLQRELPLLNDQGNLFLEGGKIACGPNGNGEVFHNFCKARVWDLWRANGIEYLNIILIDNLLADPFDAELLGFTKRKQAQLVIKGIFEKEAEIGVGILTNQAGKMGVAEYSELEGKAPDGAIGSLSLYCVSMELAKAVSTKPLPLHMVKRKAWKFETFIFDLWETGEVLIYPAEQCFAPYKRAKGEGGLESVQKRLQNWDRKCLERLREPIPDKPFELDAHLYYKALWKDP